MALDFIVIDGDAAVFEKNFSGATVDIQEGTITGSGFGTVDGAAMCVEGNETTVIVGPVPYSTSTHSTKGAGLITIDSLDASQVAEQTTTGGKPVILVGKKFNAKFTPAVPAQAPGSPPVPDNTPKYDGFGTFETANETIRGT